MQTNIFVIYSICIRLQLSLSPYMPNSWLFVMHFLCPDQHRASQKPADPFPISYINCVCFDLFWSVPGSKCGRFFILLFESEVDQMARSIYFFDNIWYIDNLHRENGKKDSKKQDSMVVVAARVLQHPDGGFTSTGQVGLCLAGPGGPGMPLVGMSGLVPPLAVEVVPSCVSNTSPFLGFGILLGPTGFGSLVAV
jgi:hypothetical protein